MNAITRPLLLALAGLSLLIITTSCEETPIEGNTEELLTVTVAPEIVSGAPFQPVDLTGYVPDGEELSIPVPNGPTIGNLEPTTPETKPEPGDFTPGAKAVVYQQYEDIDDAVPSTSQTAPEVSVAENDQTIMMTGNWWMSLSTDGGASFNDFNPTTIFPEADGGFCCDQVLHYVPQVDRFFWLLQYQRNGSGNNRLRLAAQSTADVVSSNGSSWTYWDIPSTVFDSEGWVDYNDMSFSEGSLYISTNVVGKGRVVIRIPLTQLQAGGSITYSYTGITDNAYFSHISQNSDGTVYWGGHESNSKLKIYSMRDGDGFYSWRSLDINSWPNNNNSSVCSDGQDWLKGEITDHRIFGNVVSRDTLWFGWIASAGGGFPRAHVQMAKINTKTWSLISQGQIWNNDFAFGFPYLSTNRDGEVGMSVAFGGPNDFASHAVGVWRDWVVYYPKLSNRCTERWGDYNTVRRSTVRPQEWVAGGYVNSTNGGGANIVEPHYIRFSR
ncbi:MAG: hypothetical protein MRZ79_08175 [Bacteroidia bacterium]|nr:hypothetical protein [Bacteroidia bacterium]